MKPRKKSSNIYISKKLNKNRFLEGKPSTSVTSTAPERISLLFLVITFSAVFLYSQILQTVEKNSALAITVLRSYKLTDIPIVIFPYLILLICIIFFSFILPSWAGIAFSSVYAFFQSKKIKIKIMLIVGLFIICFICGSVAACIFVSLFGFIYGGGFFASINDLSIKDFLLISVPYFILPSFGILVGLPLILEGMPIGESLRKRLVEKRWIFNSRFLKAVKVTLILLTAVTVLLPQPVNNYTDTRSCVKFIDGYDPFEKVFNTSQQNDAYYITGYPLEDSGGTLSVAVTHFGLNPIDKSGFQPDNKIIYLDKKMIEFIKPERCGLYLDNLHKNNYYK